MQLPSILLNDKTKTLLKQYSPYLGVLVVGIVIGWEMKPSKAKVTQIAETVQTKKEDTVVQKDTSTNVQKDKDRNTETRYHREITTEKHPDGTVITKETEDKGVDTVVKQKEIATQVQVVTVEKQVVVEKEKIVEKKIEPIPSQWHLGLLGGVNPQLLPTPQVNSWAVGVEAERRIAGPFWGGVWGMGMTNGQFVGGVKVGVEF